MTGYVLRRHLDGALHRDYGEYVGRAGLWRQWEDSMPTGHELVGTIVRPPVARFLTLVPAT